MTKQAIHIRDIGDSPYIASDDYPVGKTLPLLEVSTVTIEDVPVPNSNKKNKKAVVWFKGAKKGWCMNKTEGRKIGAIVGSTENIQDTWVGIKIQLHVVGDVRRPDGTRGNAFRVLHAEGRPNSSETVNVDHAEHQEEGE
jgi:hypothetical protein